MSEEMNLTENEDSNIEEDDEKMGKLLDKFDNPEVFIF